MHRPTMTPQSKKVFGVVGGMGPIASAEFMRTIYEYSAGRPEQEMPFVVLYSDPSYPDRTEALLNGDREPLLNELRRALDGLRLLGAERIVICCVTIHDLLKHLSEEERSGAISLVDIIMQSAAGAQGKYLLLSSNGTLRLRLFEDHPIWPLARHHLIRPNGEDQQTVHKLIYDLKQQPTVSRHIEEIERLLVKYGADSFAAGCTEMHLITKRLAGRVRDERAVSCIDPLVTIADALSKGRINELVADLGFV